MPHENRTRRASFGGRPSSFACKPPDPPLPGTKPEPQQRIERLRHRFGPGADLVRTDLLFPWAPNGGRPLRPPDLRGASRPRGTATAEDGPIPLPAERAKPATGWADSGEHGREDVRRAVSARRLDGMYKQRGANEHVMVRVRAPGGIWKRSTLDAVADLAERFGDGGLHFTTRGDVEMHGVAFSGVDRLLERVREAGLTTRGACGDTVRNVVACPGSGVCPCALYPAAELAGRIAEMCTGVSLYEGLPRKFKISVSGCPNACACPQIQDVGLVARHGEPEGEGPPVAFDVYLAGGLGRHAMLARKIPQTLAPAELFPFLRETIRLYSELGERKRRHRARLKFLVETAGIEPFVNTILERMGRPDLEGPR